MPHVSSLLLESRRLHPRVLYTWVACQASHLELTSNLIDDLLLEREEICVLYLSCRFSNLRLLRVSDPGLFLDRLFFCGSSLFLRGSDYLLFFLFVVIFNLRWWRWRPLNGLLDSLFLWLNDIVNLFNLYYWPRRGNSSLWLSSRCQLLYWRCRDVIEERLLALICLSPLEGIIVKVRVLGLALYLVEESWPHCSHL